MDQEGLEALEAAAECVARARYVVALTGAGLSVESGIPPFRGPNGLWTKHGEPPMNGFQRFLANPRRAWEERLNPTGPMRELWEALGSARPNPGHLALVDLEDMGVLRALITQNVVPGGNGWSTWLYDDGRMISFDGRGRAQSLAGFPAP